MDDSKKDMSQSLPNEPLSSDECCTHCGSTVDTSDWYPVTKERDEDGSLELYPFCGDECQEAWLDSDAE